MLGRFSDLIGSAVVVSDGALGWVKDVLIAQPNWRLHALQVEGYPSSGRSELMIATDLTRPGLGHAPQRQRKVVIDLTRQEVMNHVLSELLRRGDASLKLLQDRMALHSAMSLLGSDLKSSETADVLGVVQDLVFDELNWQLRYLVVDTATWWPRGRQVLIGVPWIQHVNWMARSLRVGISRDALLASPEFGEVSTLQREDEVRLHAAFRRTGYWIPAD